MRSSNVSPSVLGCLRGVALALRGGAGLIIAAALLVSSPALSQRAYAFGGIWSSQKATPIEQSADEVIFIDNPDSTVTAIIRFQYEGPAQPLVWVIPVPGMPAIEASSTTVFERLDAATAPEYWVERTLQGTCAHQDDPSIGSDAGTDPGTAPSDPDRDALPVLMIDHGSVSGYQYVNVAVDAGASDPAKAATEWLAMNGYALTDLDSEVLGAYLKQGLNLLAFKLESATDAGAIRPVMLTYESKQPVIPIRPTAVAARDDMALKVWVLGPSQAVPTNYPSLVINDALIDWLTGPTFVVGTLPSGGVGPTGPRVNRPGNYDAVVSAAADEAGGQGFVTEVAGPASQYRDKIWSAVDEQDFMLFSSKTYADGLDAVLAANKLYAGWDGWKDAVQGATTLPEGVTLDQLIASPEQYRDQVSIDTAELLQRLNDRVIKPVSDSAALFYRAPYLTRLYTTMSAQEMTADPAFNYNGDLAQVSNVHIAKQLIDCSSEQDPSAAPWRIELPQGGVVVGQGRDEWPLAIDSVPANLEIVMLTTSGSGTVIKDNAANIAMKLFDAAGTIGSGAAVLHLPHNGVLIGGSQTLTLDGDDAGAHVGADAGVDAGVDAGPSAKALGSDDCSVARPGVAQARVLGHGLAFAAMLFALRRRLRPCQHRDHRDHRSAAGEGRS